jgi:hypothetical protein
LRRLLRKNASAAVGHREKIEGKRKFSRDVATPNTLSSNANPSVKREILHLTMIKGNVKLPQPKGTPKPHMDMKYQGKIIKIKGVGLAKNVPRDAVKMPNL